MPITDLTPENIEEVVNNNEIVLISFTAPDLEPCENFAPIYEAASFQHTDVVFGRVNTEKEAALAKYFEVTSVPTLVVFCQTIHLLSQEGVIPGGAIDSLIVQIRETDMDEVRKQLDTSKTDETD